MLGRRDIPCKWSALHPIEDLKHDRQPPSTLHGMKQLESVLLFSLDVFVQLTLIVLKNQLLVVEDVKGVLVVFRIFLQSQAFWLSKGNIPHIQWLTPLNLQGHKQHLPCAR